MDRFRVIERIGSGGMGTVYRAFDERLQREVAIKEIDGADPERVLREAQAAARLNHPGVVTLYELGRRGETAMLVTELVPGRTLAELHRRGDLLDADVGQLLVELCDALAHAHSRGVVHRDLKPQNVIVTDGGRFARRAKLMDFGIARIADEPALTAAGEVVGTLAYMAPEQAEGEPAAAPADVYSLALTAYECWAGVNPVAAATPAQTVRRIGEPPPPLGNHRPDLPAPLTEVIDACLDLDPDLRPTLAELRAGVEGQLGQLSETRVPLPPGAEPADPPPAPVRLARLAALAALAAGLIAIAGPIGSPGLALVLAVLSLPAIAVGAPLAALGMPGAALLAAAGFGAGGAALGAAAPSMLARAVIGAGAWAWVATASIALGSGPDLSLAAPAPDGWATDVSVAADAVLGSLLRPEVLLGAAIFAVAAVALAAVLRASHVSIALLGAMLWAAGLDAALALVGDGGLGNAPFGIVAAAAVSVALEFWVVRGEGPVLRPPGAAAEDAPRTPAPRATPGVGPERPRTPGQAASSL